MPLLAPRPRLLTPLLALLALVAVVLAPPAHAHDVLTGSEPADGAQLEAAPSELVLTFNNNLLDSAQAVVVTDASGTTVAEGSPVIEGPEATFALPALEAGAYTATWSVVSSDGHRIDGELGFTVGDGAAEPDTATTTEPGPAPAATAAPGEMTTPDATAAADAEDDSAGSALPVWLVVLLAVGAAGAVIALAVRRWRQQS